MMAETTKISWTDSTFNPVIGCTRISPACDGCYAAHLMETRIGRVEWGGPGKGAGTRVRTSAVNWREPLKWHRDYLSHRSAWESAIRDLFGGDEANAISAGWTKPQRPFVFCASLADVFDNQWELEWRRDLFDLIRATPHLVWLLLTKRPQNIIRMSVEAGGLPPNAALGTTVEDQERAERNVPHLCEAKLSLDPMFTFVSIEPILGDIYLRSIKVNGAAFNFLPPHHDHFDALHPQAPWQIGWVIGGGETDQGQHKARPWHPAWRRHLLNDCNATGVPFHWKQNGEWTDEAESDVAALHCRFPDGVTVRRIGKARAGHLIDGIEHFARPVVPDLAVAA